MVASSLQKQLAAGLESREVRNIRRFLPPSADTALVDFSSNDYLSLSKSPELRTRFLDKLGSAKQILGSGGSRLLINSSAHADLEDRLRVFFSRTDAAPQSGLSSPTTLALDALLFNSGFDANVGFFACVPQPGDFIVYDEHVHASVHDGMRMSRARRIPFKHNSVGDLEKILLGLQNERPGLVAGNGSVFIAVESLYSMDGTVSPLADIIQIAESVFPSNNAYVSVDEAHSTGIYGPDGRGLVNLLGLQHRVFARLHTFGKALAGTGGELVHLDTASDTALKHRIYSCPACSAVSQAILDKLRSDVDIHDFPEPREHHLSKLRFRYPGVGTCRRGGNLLLKHIRSVV